MSKGGFKAFRGSPATAERYLLERDSQRLDDYYNEGAPRAVQHGVVGDGTSRVGSLDPEAFRAWMQHRDPETGEQRGSFRQRTFVNAKGETQVGGTPLYQETLISSSKSLSLAAASDPRIAEALETAQARAAVAAAEALQEHAVTRVGPKGKQRQVRFERLEFTSIQHQTSRAGDPHFHRHMQVLPKGVAEGKWRAMDGKTLYSLAERMHAAADLSMATDTELRRAVAAAGYTWEPGEGGGKVAEFERFVDEFSTRRDQIASNREMLEAQWRAEHPGQEPGPKQVQAWDQLGWAQERPEKQKKADVAVLEPGHLAAGLPAVEPENLDRAVAGQSARQIDPRAIAEGALDDLAQRRSAWSSADLGAAIDRRLAETYLLGGEDIAKLRAAALEAARPELASFYDEGVDVKGVRHYTSRSVQETEQALTEGLADRASRPGRDGSVEVDRGAFTLTDAQAAAARSIAGTHALVTIQGAAGAGKTEMLAAASDSITEDGRRLVAVAPTKQAAEEMGKRIGAPANSVHSILVAAGASFDDTGKWTLPEEWKEQHGHLRMDKDTVLVVDEAGMLDQETARALHRYADDMGVGSVVLLGDTKQLAAVGRGGYLARAAQMAQHSHDLRDVQRFRTHEGEIDEVYAAASLKLRQREEPSAFFDELKDRGQVRIGTPDEVIARVADTAALEIEADRTTVVIASTNATAQQVNRKVYERLAADGIIDTGRVVEGRDSDPIAVGARVATRQNDREMGVANRQTWTVTNVNEDGRITVKDDEGHHRTLEADYVSDNVQLAYAVTAHGSQGMTVDTAHTIVSDQMDASGLYVGLTRGRYANVFHAVAVDEADAREQFTAAVARRGADQGLDGAHEQAKQDVDGLELESSGQDQPTPQPRKLFVTKAQPTKTDPLERYREKFGPELSEAEKALAAELARRNPQESSATIDLLVSTTLERNARQGTLGDELRSMRADRITRERETAQREARARADAELGRLAEAYPAEMNEVIENLTWSHTRGREQTEASQARVDAKVTNELRAEALSGDLEPVLREQRAAHAAAAQTHTTPVQTATKPRTAAQQRVLDRQAEQAARNRRLRSQQDQSQHQGMGM